MVRIDLPGKHCVVNKADLGVAFGDYTLQRLVDLVEVDMVVDVGANIGQYASQMRRQIGYCGPLASFEPMPKAAARLRRLAEKDKAWTVRECAIDDRRGRASFNVMAGDQFSSLLPPSAEFDGKFHGQHAVADVIEVDVITLADAVDALGPFSRGLLKLDTQGNEMRILRASPDSLARFPVVQMEVGFQALYEGAEPFNEVVAAFAQWGYRLSALFPNNRGHFPHLLEMDALFLRASCFPALG